MAVHEVRKQITARGSEVTVRWAPAYQRVEGNEMADTWAKAAADGSSYEDERAYLRVMRLSHMTRMSTETRPQVTGDWMSNRVGASRRYRPPRGGMRPELRSERKALTGRYYQS